MTRVKLENDHGTCTVRRRPARVRENTGQDARERVARARPDHLTL
jgi:hypothetical protein